jgi:hypothetical protein
LLAGFEIVAAWAKRGRKRAALARRTARAALLRSVPPPSEFVLDMRLGSYGESISLCRKRF